MALVSVQSEQHTAVSFCVLLVYDYDCVTLGNDLVSKQ